MDRHALDVLEFSWVRDQLAALCDTEMGRRVASDLEPSDSLKRIETSIRQVGEARGLLEGQEPLGFAGVADLRTLINGAHGENRPLEPVELLSTLQTLRRAAEVRVQLEMARERVPSLWKLAEQLTDHSAVVDAIDRIVVQPGEVRDKASDELWDLRRAIRRQEEEIRETLNSVLSRSRVKAALQSPTISIRNGRFVVPVKVDQRGRVPGILHDHSQSGATVFIEPSEIVEDSNRLNELRLDETKEENRILWEISRTVYRARPTLRHTTDVLAWLDFTSSRARFSVQGDMIAPEIASNGELSLRQARHPLLQATLGAEAVVPLDVRLNAGFRILVITGPNTGGKTVTLKTVGLLQLMFQSGLHVPVARGSRMPVFKRIHADIGDEQSITQNLSTFSGHIRNIASILEEAAKDTLVLLDELGAGTDPTEGAALGRAILEQLRERGSAAVVTTHLGSLKEYAFANAEVENACVEFDERTMRPLYRLMIGQPGNSNALEIARRHGIPEAVLDRARVELDGQEGEEKGFIESLQNSRIALEETRKESDRRLEESRSLEKAASDRLEYVEKKERRLGREAELLVDEAFRDLLSRLEPHLRELQNVPKSLLPAHQELEQVLRSSLRETSLGKRRRVFIRDLGKGDVVLVPRFDQVCRIKKLNRTEEKMTVMVGTMTVEIGFDDVSWVDPRNLDE